MSTLPQKESQNESSFCQNVVETITNKTSARGYKKTSKQPYSFRKYLEEYVYSNPHCSTVSAYSHRACSRVKV